MSTTQGPKRKSNMRWEQGRRLYSVVCPSLPTPSHVAVLMFCWFHASGRDCCFGASHSQIADCTKLSYERVRKIMADLIDGGVIVTTKESAGRGYAAQRRITGKPYRLKEGGHP